MTEPETTSERRVDRTMWGRLAAVLTVSCAVIAAAAAWFLLNQLTTVLRPLLVAVFLAYVLMPYHTRLRKVVGGPVSIGILASLSAASLVGLALAVSLSVVELSDELPRMQVQFQELIDGVEHATREHAPWLSRGENERGLVQRLGEFTTRKVPSLFNAAGDALLEAFVIALYLLFLLLGASHFPARVRMAYPPERADTILHVAGEVNAAIIGYLKAKVKSSLILALPSGLVLGALGVKFALLWTVLIFLCNFVPYVGSVVGYSLPVSFALIQLGVDWHIITIAVALLAIQVISATLVEPTILGKAVGLSPLVILAALSFWGLLWGLPGMVLAVPLTVVALIVMSQFESTRAFAKLATGD